MKCARLAAVVAALLMAVSAASGHEFKIKHLEFIHPWTREPAKGVTDVPVYMVVRNTSPRIERIIGASSPFAASAELHASKLEGGGTIAALQLPAGEVTELNADGPHLLLRGLTEPLDGYQYFPVVLMFEHAGKVEIEDYVEEPNSRSIQ
jgi:copper(I)-binding protein